MTDLLRFEAKFSPCPASGCWLWDSATDLAGYGVFAAKQADGSLKTVRAHRFAYETYVGQIPDGLIIMHKCDVPACVNPRHLRCGTQQENMTDKVLKNRQAKGEGHGLAKLTEADVDAIRSLYGTLEYTQVELAEMFNTSQANVSLIVTAKHWAHVPVAA